MKTKSLTLFSKLSQSNLATIANISFKAIIIALLVVLSLPSAKAQSVTDVINAITTYSSGTGDPFVATPNGDETIITVTGSKTDATESLTLEIPAGVTVKWEATLTGTSPGTGESNLISLSGEGTFEIADGAVIHNNRTGTGGGRAINTSGAMHIVMNGGEVTSNSGVAIRADNAGAKVTINDGTVTGGVNNQYYPALFMTATNPTVSPNLVINDGTVQTTVAGANAIRTRGNTEITGGTITATTGRAISAEEANRALTISGGEISVTGGGSAIWTNGNGVNVTVSGDATVSATGGNNARAIHISAGSNTSVTVTDNAVVSSAGLEWNGPAISVTGSACAITISGNAKVSGINNNIAVMLSPSSGTNTVTVSDNVAISSSYRGFSFEGTGATTLNMTGGTITHSGAGGTNLAAIVYHGGNDAEGARATINISGGTVRSTGTASAIGTATSGTLRRATITIAGGEVWAGEGFAVHAPHANTTVAVSGDALVFAHGAAISDVISGGFDDVEDDAIVIAWNSAQGSIYGVGTRTALTTLPAERAVWAIDDTDEDNPLYGIAYANGGNAGFFELESITVVLPQLVTVVGGTLTADGETTGNFYWGETISITANTPEVGKKFVDWTFNVDTDNNFFVDGYDEQWIELSFIMPNENVTATANFDDLGADDFTISVTSSVNGAVTIRNNAGLPITWAKEDDVITLVAVADDGYRFDSWTIDPEVEFEADGESTLYTLNSNPLNFVMPNANVEITATFVKTYNVTFNVVGGNGSLTAAVGDNDISSGAVDAGSDIVFTATPSQAWYLVSQWSLNGTPIADHTDYTYTLENLQADANVTVEFEYIAALRVAADITNYSSNFTAVANATHDTVTVTGSRTGANNSTLTLNIPEDITVLWQATLTGAMGANTDAFVNLTGTGIFEVASGGRIEASRGRSINNNSTGVVIVSTGGQVLVTGGGDGGSAIRNSGNGEIRVTGGTVRATSTNTYAIENAWSQGSARINVSSGTVEGGGTSTAGARAGIHAYAGSVTISGGTVRGSDFSGSSAIRTYNYPSVTITISQADDNIPTLITSPNSTNGGTIHIESGGSSSGTTTVNIQGGTVQSTSGNSNAHAITRPETNATVNINISGGTVRADAGNAVNVNANTTVNVTGGTVRSSGSGRAINTTGSATIQIDGGTVQANSGHAIHQANTGTVRMTSGTVHSTGSGRAINADGSANIQISGGRVFTTNTNTVIHAPSAATFTISNNALVYGYGSAILGANNIINRSEVNPTGDAVIIAWDNAQGNRAYFANSKTDLISLPDGCAEWEEENELVGIAYANGTNIGFIPMPGVSLLVEVTDPTQRLVNITGKTPAQAQAEIQAVVGFADEHEDEKTVTVTGSITGATVGITLDIPEDVTVKWGATLSGNLERNTIITLNGNGMFEVVEGGLIKNTGTDGSNHDHRAIIANGAIQLVVSGGEVRAERGSAIYSSSANVEVTVTGSAVVSSAGSAWQSSVIRTDASDNITVSGNATVQGTEDGAYALRVLGNTNSNGVRISGNAKIIGTTRAISLEGNTPSLTLTGGTVTASSGSVVIYYNEGVTGRTTINIEGGVVQATGAGRAIGTSTGGSNGTADITISGGMVRSENGLAIHAPNANTIVAVSGDALVFAHGAAISNVISGGFTDVEDEAVVIAYNTAIAPPYGTGSTNALTSLPADNATWGVDENDADIIGIFYENGTNAGFIPVEGVTVSDDYLTVTFVADGEGDLTATVDGQEILTGADVLDGKTVIFTATPEPGYHVAGWTLDGDPIMIEGDEGDEEPFTGTSHSVELEGEAIDVTVAFAINKYEITISANPLPADVNITVKIGEGSVEDLENADLTAIEHGTIVVVTATANEGWRFDKWTADAETESDSEYTFTVTGDISVVANFIELFNVNVVEGNLVNPGDFGTYFAAGEQVTITTELLKGTQKFVEWTFIPATVELVEGYTPQFNRLIFVMPNEDVTATATFDDLGDESLISVISHVNGAVTVSNAAGLPILSATADDIVTLAAQPDNGYRFDVWTIDPEVALEKDEEGEDLYTLNYNPLNFVMPAENVEISATFVKVFDVTFAVVNATGGTLTAEIEGNAINSGASIDAGNDIIFTATPAAAWYTIKEWTLNGVTLAHTNNTVEFDNLDTDVNITVEFEYHAGLHLAALIEAHGLTAVWDADELTVTATGTVTGATSALTLNIPEEITVVWEAELTGDVNNDGLIRLTGTGTFEMTDGLLSNTGAGNNRRAIQTNVAANIIISGGE
ncbi:MAG: hypothetical protein FWG79_04375, partial [Bacteroidales bacterium]|nr:hypothetical protein [Bacteroidales bacterium]